MRPISRQVALLLALSLSPHLLALSSHGRPEPQYHTTLLYWLSASLTHVPLLAPFTLIRQLALSQPISFGPLTFLIPIRTLSESFVLTFAYHALLALLPLPLLALQPNVRVDHLASSPVGPVNLSLLALSPHAPFVALSAYTSVGPLTSHLPCFSTSP